ncbi:hypothetical protein QCD60_30380 [Pokkaliibacter sp. MBI-7]|uniref:hypothetical protein n=1 Tax=Pokkaliibacter sp. MBI-7 TaxID=3040600 RepID=UPI0024488303|nr:hypothetical protein [Pokkaliibacter sp. MBI-7]MDH2431029.1 hypothetical protein [Pokkaliibacter sp. MBI-7]MDH2436724.1 hypothetical protein [Pokkaliibacter sp. MBI-7]MDH2436824.1 hypothetical protein [Pokkaliibacter sp. MBI-7]
MSELEQAQQNPATLADQPLAPPQPPSQCCDEPLLFAMRDNYHAFSMPLTTIMGCVAIAEARGILPPLPESWWVEVGNAYNWPIQQWQQAGAATLQPASE